MPVARHALGRIGTGCDVLTYVSEFCRRRIATALSDDVAARMVRLALVSTPRCSGRGRRRDHPETAGHRARSPGPVSVSRFVDRAGQDALIKAMPYVLSAVPDALLLLVGDGPTRGPPRPAQCDHDLARSVVFAGAVPWSEAPGWFDVGDVFAMPCRTRKGGLEPEALGIVFLEAGVAIPSWSVTVEARPKCCTVRRATSWILQPGGDRRPRRRLAVRSRSGPVDG